MVQIRPGAKIRNVRMKDVMGTFGCLVRARSNHNKLYILSAAHVLGLNGYAEPGDVIEAEDSPGSQTWTPVGTFERATQWRHVDGVFQQCDAALALVTNPALVSGDFDGIGPPGEVATGLYEGMNLKFHGAGTGAVGVATLYKFGVGAKAVYQDLGDGTLFELEYADQILYVKDDAGTLSSPTTYMDSGALVLTEENFPVGLHFSRTTDDFPVRAAVCTPLNTVLSVLDVELIPLASAAVAPAVQLPWQDDVGVRAFAEFQVMLRSQLEPHTLYGGARWSLGRDGLIVDNKLDRSPGEMVTIPRVWKAYSTEIVQAATKYKVPVELIVATICTESSGNPDAQRTEPHWISDLQTPDQVSAGLMQTLISTARDMLPGVQVDRQSLLQPAQSILAGTAYISHQRQRTQFDPPLVACAYNAGRLESNAGSSNRWKLLQYPVDSGQHADRFVQWFNDCFAYLCGIKASLPPQVVSFVQLLRG